MGAAIFDDVIRRARASDDVIIPARALALVCAKNAFKHVFTVNYRGRGVTLIKGFDSY